MTGPLASAAAEPSPHATVLLYHKFDESQHPTTNISSEEFTAQLTYLRDHEYNVLDMDTFFDHVDSDTPFPARSVLITIDDPYRSIYEVAWPILREFGYPFTVFVWTAAVEDDYGAMMSWDMLEEMAAAGVTIGNHTHTHPRMGTPRPGQTREAYKAWVTDEIMRARNLLAAHGMDNDLLAYPYGEYNEVVMDVARRNGFTLMFAQDPGAVDMDTPLTRIPRAALVGAEQTEADFVEKLSYDPLHVSTVSPRPGFLSTNPPGPITMTFGEPGRYRPGVINMFVSEWGRVEARFDPETGQLSYQADRPFTRPFNRVIVSALDRETGRYSMYAQMLFRPFTELARQSEVSESP